MSVRLSETKGLDPMLVLCFVCRESKEILLPGSSGARIRREAGLQEHEDRITIDKKPCDSCKEIMQNATILISVRNGESGENPYRTGSWVAIKNEPFKRIFNQEPSGVAFVEDEAWDKIGLPRKEIKGVPKTIEEYHAK